MDVGQVRREYDRIWWSEDKVDKYQRLRYLRELEAAENVHERWEQDEQGKYILVALVPQRGISWGGA